jgi:2-keto-4-pentenoate hydratase
VTSASFAQELARARREGRCVNPELLRSVSDLDDAYRIQSELAALAQASVRGWKVTALTSADQAKFRSSRPVAGMLLGRYVHPAPATLALSDLIAPLLECEIAFVLGRDLPVQTTPYRRSDIEAAIAEVVPAFEIADSRVPQNASDLLKLADCMGNGALVAGAPIAGRGAIDVTNIDIVLRRDGEIVGRGSSTRILGDPLLAVLALANAQPLPAGGLKKGQIVTTGTCADPVELGKGDYVAEFGPLGVLRMTIV